MKSYLNIPRVKEELTNRDLSVITTCYDKYFGYHYILYEGRSRAVMTKELNMCYRKHAQLVKDEKYDWIPLRLINYYK